MKIQKRNGSFETVKFDKILSRIKKQTWSLSHKVDPWLVAKKVIDGLYDKVTTVAVDELASEVAASMATDHYEYSVLASRIAISALHKRCKKPFSEVISDLYNYKHPVTKTDAALITDEMYKFVQENKEEIDQAIVFDRDFNHDYFGFKTLERSYLLKMNGQIAECPQHMWMRVACGIWTTSIENAIKTYDLLSQGFFTHATPTLFNSGTKSGQLSSCFLLKIEDSLDHIYKIVSDCAKISKSAGGLGVNASNIRGKGSYIKSTNGQSNGLIPMLKVLEATARYVDQGGQKRKGSIAVYLEPWHSDIYDFLDLRKNSGKEELRCRDLFTAVWMPNLFMERVEADQDWTLMCPDECPGLTEVYGERFKLLYEQYEKEGRGKKTVKAREVLAKIIDSQEETGTPYIVFKDAVNERSNQKNLGTIQQSNLCVEIVEFTSKKEHATCNLASIALTKYVENNKINFNALKDVAYQVCLNLNRVIDINMYPVPETKLSNDLHRPIGIGIQGLADVFAILKIPFDSEEARKLDSEMMETIYYGAMCASKDLAIKDGPYQSFKGSPLSEGKFQFDLAGASDQVNGRWDWDALRKEVMEHGTRNSLLIALMPTASTSNILGNNECFEPFTSNIYIRNTLSGSFPVVNKHLIHDLEKLDLWNEEIRNEIIRGNGSVQHIKAIPEELKAVYKTAWEISQKKIIDMAASRGVFVCQSQSMNLFIENSNAAKVSSALFYGFKKGLKTGIYYLRTRQKNESLKSLAIDMSALKEKQEQQADDIACSLDNPEACMACGS